jgi:hypothetical protein
VTARVGASTTSKALERNGSRPFGEALHGRTLHPPIEADICLPVEVDSDSRVTTGVAAGFYAGDNSLPIHEGVTMGDHAPVLSGIDDISAFQPEFSSGCFAEFVATQSALGFLNNLQVIGSSDSVALLGRNLREIRARSPHQRPKDPSGSNCHSADAATKPHHPDAHARLGGGSDALVDGRPPRITKLGWCFGCWTPLASLGAALTRPLRRGADTRRLLGLAGGSTRLEIR